MVTNGHRAARKRKQQLRFLFRGARRRHSPQGDTVPPWASTSGTWPGCATSSPTACRLSSSEPCPTSSRTRCPTCGGGSARRSSRLHPVSRRRAPRRPGVRRGRGRRAGRWGFVARCRGGAGLVQRHCGWLRPLRALPCVSVPFSCQLSWAPTSSTPGAHKSLRG